MVRLGEEHKLVYPPVVEVRFNSSMVRLGGLLGFDNTIPLFVSIPVWCD